MFYKDYIRVLNINAENGNIRIDSRKDLMPYLGGVGVASKLLEENMRPELPPLAPEQPIVFAIGAATFVFPVLTKTVAMFRSPLTGELGESYAGGRLAMCMLFAGYDAIVITGKSPKPCYLTIGSSNVSKRDARAFWGLDHGDVGRFIRDRDSGGGKNSGKRSIIRIGPAGENCVAFASASVDTYRHFGRLGLGAVLGSKNIKAISVAGDKSISIENREYFKLYQQIYKKCTQTDGMKKYHDAGTPINIEPLNVMGGLPTKNLQSGRFEESAAVSGEAFAKINLVRKLACTGCPVGCIHIGMYRRQFDDGHEYEAISVGYDYELIYALGTFLGIKTSDEIIALIDEVEETGMDAMSAGVALGWATEAYAKGLITDEQTIVPLSFGDSASYIRAIRYLGIAKNQFYKDLGKGSAYAAKTYGGGDFALQIAGNEMPGYHTGYGSLVGVAVGARHSHLCNGGYSVDQAAKEFDEDNYINKIFAEEKERCMTNSLIMCLFARKVYDRETIKQVLAVLGRAMTDADLDEVAGLVYETKLRIKKAYGFKQTEIKLPKRFFETPTMHGQLSEEVAQRMIEKYNLVTDNFVKERAAKGTGK